MRFEPFLPVLAIALFTAVALAGIGWIVYQTKRQHKQWSAPWLRRAGLVAALAVTLLGPSFPGAASSPGVANLDVLFLVDTTASMGALDYDGGELRIKGIKQDMLAIANKLKGAHMGIITFDAKATTVLAFSSDNTTFSGAVQTIDRELYGTSNGSAIDKPVELALEQLKVRKAANPERSRLLFYMGDGEQTSQNKVRSFSELATSINGGAVLGYGTKAGSQILKYTSIGSDKQKNNSQSAYIRTLSSSGSLVPAVSKLDETALNTIAKDTKLPYINRNQPSDIANVIEGSNAEILIDEGRLIRHYYNLYWLFAIPLAGLLFWEWKSLLLLSIEVRGGRGKKHA